MRRTNLYLLTVLFLLLTACTKVQAPVMPVTSPDASQKADNVMYQKTKFSRIKFWEADNHKHALAVFLQSCEKWNTFSSDRDLGIAGKISDWRVLCDKARMLTSESNKNKEYKAFFEKYFTPYQLISNAQDQGLFTGYYEILLDGSMKHGGKYQYPLYQRPRGLVQFNVNDFIPDAESQMIFGLVKGKKLIPVPPREKIEQGAIKTLEPLMYLSDGVDGFFLHIQGSGKVRMDDGTMVNVGYAGKNGKPYTAVGKLLYRDGHLDRSQLNAIAIREWLKEHPKLARGYMNQNESFIFFRRLSNDLSGPIGSLGVPLTPRRSLAVDTRYVPLGIPVWVDIDLSESASSETRFTGLMMAQDTGSAIKGGIRGDIFFGFGKYAELMASHFKQEGTMHILLPKSVKVN